MAMPSASMTSFSGLWQRSQSNMPDPEIILIPLNAPTRAKV